MLPPSCWFGFKVASIAAFAVASLVSSVSASAEVVYVENFTRSASGGNLAVSGFGWNAYSGAGAVDISTAGAPTNTDAVAVSPAAGNPGPEAGALYAINALTPGQRFAVVETFGTGLPLGEGSHITWTMGNGHTAATVRVLVQIAGNGTPGSGSWYASEAVYSSSTGYALFSAFSAAQTSGVTCTFDFTTIGSAWRSFSLTPGTSAAAGSMSIAGAALAGDLPSATITGLGFYMVAGPVPNQAIRIDTLSVDAAPTVWVVVRPQDSVEEVRSLLQRKVVGGVVYYPTLRTLEPQEGVYDWSGIDGIVALCAEAKKPLKLAVLGGRWIPEWLYAKGAQKFTWTHTTSYVDAGQGTASACVPWDPIYLSAMETALRACAQRHGANPWLIGVQATGPELTNGLEMDFIITPTEAAGIGYSMAKLADAWIRMTDVCAAAFPRQSLSLALHNNLLGVRTTLLSAQVRDTALARYPGRVSLLVCYATPESWFQRGNSAVDVWADAPGGPPQEAQLIDLFSAKGAPVSDVALAIRKAVELGASRIEIFFDDLRAPAYREGVEATLGDLGSAH